MSITLVILKSFFHPTPTSPEIAVRWQNPYPKGQRKDSRALVLTSRSLHRQRSCSKEIRSGTAGLAADSDKRWIVVDSCEREAAPTADLIKAKLWILSKGGRAEPGLRTGDMLTARRL